MRGCNAAPLRPSPTDPAEPPTTLAFAWAHTRACAQVRGLTKAGDGAIVVLDIPAGGKYYNGAAEHLGNTQQLIDDLEGGKLEAQQMSR